MDNQRQFHYTYQKGGCHIQGVHQTFEWHFSLPIHHSLINYIGNSFKLNGSFNIYLHSIHQVFFTQQRNVTGNQRCSCMFKNEQIFILSILRLPLLTNLHSSNQSCFEYYDHKILSRESNIPNYLQNIKQSNQHEQKSNFKRQIDQPQISSICCKVILSFCIHMNESKQNDHDFDQFQNVQFY